MLTRKRSNKNYTLVNLQDSSMVRTRDIISSFITEVLLALKELIKLSFGFAQCPNYMAQSGCSPPDHFAVHYLC
jgi:hypothetical protein